MGDNRTHSADSRSRCTNLPGDAQRGLLCTGDPEAGTVPVGNVIGKARFIAWPPSRWGGVQQHQPADGIGRLGVPALPASWPQNSDPQVRPAHPGDLRCTATASARSPVSMRSVAVPAPVRWWWPSCVLGPNRLTSLAALDDSKKLNRSRAGAAVPADPPVCAGLSRGFHPVGRSGPPRCASRQHRGHAPRRGRTAAAARVRALRRLPGTGAADAVTAGDRRRCRGRVYRRAASVLAKVSRDRLMVRDGDRTPRIRLCRAQGLQHAGAHGRAGRLGARAASTATRLRMCGGLRDRCDAVADGRGE